jgi:hypothetical protein
MAYTPPPFPSFPDPDTLDSYFVAGRNMWPDLDEFKKWELDRSQVPDKVIDFLRSTSLIEYGVSQYVRGYLEFYGHDFKLAMWSAIWAAEEYTHYLVLRRMLEALGDGLTAEDFAGLERGDFYDSYVAYLHRLRIDGMDPRMEQLVFGVVQEHSAAVAYTAAAKHCGIPELAKVLKRIARDEVRHSRFNQVGLESMVRFCPAEQREMIWPMFRRVIKDLEMPQAHVAYFDEKQMGSELYHSFWDAQDWSRMVLYLTQYFGRFRKPLEDSVEDLADPVAEAVEQVGNEEPAAG